MTTNLLYWFDSYDSWVDDFRMDLNINMLP